MEQKNETFQWDDATIAGFVAELLLGKLKTTPLLEAIEQFKQSKQPKEKPKEWEIVAVMSGGGRLYVYRSGFFVPENAISVDQSNIRTAEELLAQGGTIHAVKRLSDGVVFSVGDKVAISGDCLKGWDRNPPHMLTLFYLNDDQSLSIACESDVPVVGDIERGKRTGAYMSGSFRIEQLSKAKPVLFTTHDGKDIFEGDEYYGVDKRFNISVMSGLAWYSPQDGSKYFSTREAAEAWARQHKPSFSFADIQWVCGAKSFIGTDFLIAQLKESLSAKNL